MASRRRGERGPITWSIDLSISTGSFDMSQYNISTSSCHEPPLLCSMPKYPSPTPLMVAARGTRTYSLSMVHGPWRCLQLTVNSTTRGTPSSPTAPTAHGGMRRMELRQPFSLQILPSVHLIPIPSTPLPLCYAQPAGTRDHHAGSRNGSVAHAIPRAPLPLPSVLLFFAPQNAHSASLFMQDLTFRSHRPRWPRSQHAQRLFLVQVQGSRPLFGRPFSLPTCSALCRARVQARTHPQRIAPRLHARTHARTCTHGRPTNEQTMRCAVRRRRG